MILGGLLGSVSAGGLGFHKLKVVDLRCEYRREAIGFAPEVPRLSWRLAPVVGKADGLMQAGYQFEVENLGRGSKWLSPEFDSAESVNAPLKGFPSSELGEVRVRVKEAHSGWSSWSEPVQFSGGGDTDKLVGEAVGPTDPGVTECWFRKVIHLAAVPKRAILKVDSRCYYELYLNGKKMGGDVLFPSISDLSKGFIRSSFDISKYLKPGDNAVGIWAGSGWATYSKLEIPGVPEVPMIATRLSFPDNAEWSWNPGPSQMLGGGYVIPFGGELIDGRLDNPTWSEVKTSVKDWKPVIGFNALLKDRARVNAVDSCEPDKVAHVLKPAAVTRNADGSVRIDMGRNFAGWIEFPVEGKEGDKITVQWSERTDQAETYGLHSEYVLGKSGKGVFCNRFNYGSGRWITVKGLGAAPPTDRIRGLQIRSSFEPASDFECSNPLLNKIYQTTLWTFENLSLGGYVVDCPQRERRGYGGDAHSTTPTALDNYAMGAFYTKWLGDWRSVQYESGDLPATAPTYEAGGGPPWGGFCIFLPMMLHRQYGDERVVRENYSMMQRWLAFMESKSSDGLLRRYGGQWDFLSDWVWPYDADSDIPNGDRPDTLFFNNCYLAYAYRNAAKLAAVIGEAKDAVTYRSKADLLCKTIHERYYRPATHDYQNGRQNHLAAALIAGVPPPEETPPVWQRLESEINEHRGGHIDAGITGGALLTRLLIEENRADLMYPMVLKEDYPSWGYFLKSGQTTWPESWDNSKSQLHSSYVFVGSWFIEGLLGIRPGPQGGFQEFELRPLLNLKPSLEHVKGHYDSMWGRIGVEWKVRGGAVQLDLDIPPNTAAHLFVKEALIDEHGEAVSPSLRLEPGHHSFVGKVSD